MFEDWLNRSYDWLLPFGKLFLSGLVGLLLCWMLFRIIYWYGNKRNSLGLQSIYRRLRRPGIWLGAVVALLIALPGVQLSEQLTNRLSLMAEITLYLFGGWLLIDFTDVAGDIVRDRFRISEEDNLTERKIITQFSYIKRVVSVVVFVIAAAFILLQFERVRELGTGLLTSAGVAGIIIGLAAQKSIANLLAGFQLAFTQPIRIDDIVIVEGEFGRVEEITLTYVVVRIWDERRLVVPLNYFNEKPFQNWTRSSTQMLTYIYLYMDYRVPVEAIRKELTRLLANTELWDGRVNRVQVTDAGPNTMEIRPLMSARNAGEAWDLRCMAREHLIAFIQEHYPESLPTTRVEFPEQRLENGSGTGTPPDWPPNKEKQTSQ